MRKPILTMLLAGAFLLMFSTCKKDSEVNIDQIEITDDISSLGTNSVTISGTYSYSGTIDGITAHLSENGVHPKEFVAVISGKNFAVEMTELSPGTTYQYYYSVDYGFSKPFKTGTRSFTTKSETPSVKALEVLEIDSTTFRIKCEALSDGGQEVTERGIYWNTYGDPTIGDNTIQSAESGLGIYTIRMENLAMGKKYFVRAYAKNAAGIGLSEEVLDFETEVSAGASVDIELSCNPEEGGTVSGGGSYEVGTQCTATAVANTGYTFVNWTENDIQVSSNAEYTFTVTTGRNLVANFTKQAYVITAQVDPEDSGTVTGAGGYNYGEECTLTATAKTGYDFVKWTKGGTTVSTDAEYSFTVTATATYVAHFSIKSYSVSVSANPSNGGTVSGGGTFNYGESHTVHATPADGFAFSNWTDDGDEVSTDADYTFTVSSNRNLVANFTVLQPNEYSITVSANPSEGGTVTGSGTYQQGQSCTVKATSKPNFIFVNWTENGNQVSDLAEYTFTVTGNRVLVANFEAQAPTEYTVSASANPSNGGTVTGGGTYQQGQQCTVTATANEGYNFTNWTEGGNVVSTQASYTFTVNSDRNLVANFTIKSYTINASANPSNGGTVTGAGSYNHGQSCTLSATATSGYTFTNWTENGNQVSTNANYTFTVTGNRTLVANFAVQAPNTYTINVSANPSTGGTVTGGGSYNQGASCTVTATANTGYTFLKWTENGNQVSTNPNYTFTVTGNRTLVAQFQVQSYTITASANPTNGGSVSGGGNYNYGQSCTLTATAANGYTFIRWTENGNQVSTNANYTFTVTSNRTLVAQFQVQSFTITASANPTNGGSVSGGGNYNYGQSCTLTAAAATGYTFIRWTENGNQVSTNANYTFTVTGNRTLVAQFQQQSYTITASANPTNGGSVSGGGTYNYGQSCTVNATANTGYTFTNWTENGNVVSTNANYTFTVTSNRTLVANFTVQGYTINVSASPSNGGSVSGGGNYNYGQSCTVQATANNGYTFTNWTENGSVVSTNASYTFTVTTNRTLVANFTVNPQNYAISVSANPTNGGTVTGGGTYQQGQSCTVTATTATGYTFLRWTENGNQVSTNPNYTFTVTGNRTLVAQFQAQSYTISVSASPSSGGSVSGGGNYNYGQSCTVHATANSGYTFTSWTENGNVVSTNANYTFTINANRTLVANFTIQSYTISVSASPSNGGSVSGGGNYNYGQSCTVYATANSGYTFTNWTEGTNVVSTNATYSFQVTINRTLVANFTAQPQAPQGAINGLFTINSNGDQVYFSKGNLQYIGSASTPYWKFADNQWDCLGTTTGQNSTNQNVDRDLFGWGTSGWSGSGATYYRPRDTDNSNGSLYGPPGQNDLTGTYAHADWGVHNSISNTTGQWRTLTQPEWDYVFDGRITGTRFAKACVNGVHGVILFPDSYTHPNGVTQLTGINEMGNAGWSGNNYTASDFGLMQDAGAVFLPTTGIRDGTSVYNVGSYGYYWSSSCNVGNNASSRFFGDDIFGAYDYYRYYGFAVRLVYDY